MLMSVNTATKAGINFKNTDHGKLLETHKNYFLFLYGTVAWKNFSMIQSFLQASQDGCQASWTIEEDL